MPERNSETTYSFAGQRWLLDEDRQYARWRERPWKHWRHADNYLIRVFPPPEGHTEWMGAEYETFGGELHPSDYMSFNGGDPKELAFQWAAERFKKLKAKRDVVLRGP